MPSFGVLLRRLRGNRSQREVANEMDIPITTLSSLENQENPPRGPQLHRLAHYYGVPITYFYGEAEGSRSTSAARAWLQSVRDATTTKETVATYADPSITEEVKAAVARAIHKKKHAETSHD